MIVLTVHNAYRQPGGEDVVFEQESRALEDAGHTVYRYHEDNHRIAGLGQLAAAFSAVWSPGAYRRIAQLVRETGCQVVHFHNTFPLISPAAYWAARAAGAAVVQTLHNYRILCPNALFYRAGAVCQECLGARLAWRGAVRGCYRGSRLASASAAAMAAAHRALGTWREQVDLYIAPSQLCRDKFLEAGFAAARLAVKPGFVDPDPGPGGGRGDFCLFAGRLSAEKGLDTLLEAWRGLGPRYPLKIVGDGPLAPLVASAARQMPWIEWLGQRTLAEVLGWMGRARALIESSQAFSTFGLVVVEAFAKATPVVVSAATAGAELVGAGETGVLFSTGSPTALAEAVRGLLGDEARRARMGRAARAEYLARYTAARNAARLVDLYRRAAGLAAVPVTAVPAAVAELR